MGRSVVKLGGLLVGVLVLTSCYFHGKTFSEGPYPKAYISILTNIKPFDYPWHSPPSDTTGVYILAVDGREVPFYARGGPVLQEIEVYPGKHRVDLVFKRTLGQEGEVLSPHKATIEIETKANRTYLMDARVDPAFNRWYPVVVDLKEVAITPRSFYSDHE